MLARADNEDLKGGKVADYLVVGWFTPDYYSLAHQFTVNLNEHGIPFHLFAKPKLDLGWNTTRKPNVVLEAMALYPERTIVLMDVDCIVRGDIEPITRLDGADVGVCVIARDMFKRDRRQYHWLALECSSRVVVFAPTAGARAFAERWMERIERSAIRHDEHAMAWAYLLSPAICFSYIDQRYSGREVGSLEDVVIEHDSAHDRLKCKARHPVKEWLKKVERRLIRSGRTKASKLECELSVLP